MREKGFVIAPIIIVAIIAILGTFIYIKRDVLLNNLAPSLNASPIAESTQESINTPTAIATLAPKIITTLPPTKKPVVTSVPKITKTPTPAPVSTTAPNTSFSVTQTGRVFADANCNDMQEPNEVGIPGVTIHISLMPSYEIYTTIYSDSNGYYNFTTTLPSAQSYITFQASDVAAPGYKIYYPNHTTTLNMNSSTANKDLSQVPGANIGLCP